MSKSTDIELAQLKRAVAYLADGLDNLADAYLQEAQGSPLKEYLAGCARVAGQQASTLRLLVGKVEKLDPGAEKGDIRAAVGQAAQAAQRIRTNPLDTAGIDPQAADLLARIRRDIGLE